MIDIVGGCDDPSLEVRDETVSWLWRSRNEYKRDGGRRGSVQVGLGRCRADRIDQDGSGPSGSC